MRSDIGGEAYERVEFLGDSLSAIKAFPEEVRREIGVQLYLVQQGVDPNDWKPLATVGQGVREIRVRDEAGAFRVLYVTRIADAIYVLHAFQKKTQQTDDRDIRLARMRLRQI